jgi:hypothetical protein
MAMPLDYTLPLFDVVQNYFLNVTIIAANECFKPLLNDYHSHTDERGMVYISGTHDRVPLTIILHTKLGDKTAYYKVCAIVKWDKDPDHDPFDMILESHMKNHPIKDFDMIRNALVAALQAKDPSK